jgi:hypothetical protein
LLVFKQLIFLGRHRTLFAEADVILARNLEMLALGVRGRALAGRKPVLIYECLDIHGLMLSESPVGFIMRGIEGWLSRRAAALFTSSPAFVSQYFEKRSRVHLPVRLIENKMPAAKTSAHASRPQGPPWIIGWYGIIRCGKSLKILGDLVRQSGGDIEVVLRGKPDLVQFENFEKSATELPGLRFLGPYKYPDDLAGLYGSVHFNWAIDMFEEHLNSSWLLPNRLYEGGAFGAVPIALDHVETGRFLKRLGLGVTIKEPLRRSLETFFKELTPDSYRTLQEAVAGAPHTLWTYDRPTCLALVNYMRSLTGDEHG